MIMFKSYVVCVVLMLLSQCTSATTFALFEHKSDLHFEPESNYTAAVGSSFTLKCISSNPIILRRRSAGDFIKRTDDDYFIMEEYPEYFVMEHKLTSLTYKDVGWFDCYEKYQNNPKNVSFYLFVDDPIHLMIGPKNIRVSVKYGNPVVIPCLPTAPDVNVNLLTSREYPVSFSTNPKHEGKEEFYYHPTSGIVLPSRHKTDYWFIYICDFSKRGVEQRKYIEIFVDFGGFRKNIDYLEFKRNIKRKVDAKPGTDVELLAEVFTNYEPTLHWYDPKNNKINPNSKYMIEHTMGEPYETRLTIYDVSPKDNGVYRVKEDYYREIDFYVNVTDVSTMKIEMSKLFLVSEDDFLAFCSDTGSRSVQTQTWTFIPYNCEHEHNCEVIALPGNEDKMQKYGITFSSWIPRVIMFTKHTSANLTCTMLYDDGKIDSITRPLIVSEAIDGFEIEHQYGKYGDSKNINLTCTVSRFLYSENLYWIGSDGFVIEKSRNENWRNLTVTRSETIYSYRVTLLMEVKEGHQIPVEEYKCMAVDYNQLPSFKSYVLNLKGDIPATIFKSNMKNDSQLVAFGETLSLTCYAGGLPNPTLHWYKNGVKIGKQRLPELELILNINDSGRYSCKVENLFGSDSAYVDVEVYFLIHMSINDTVSADGWSLKGEEIERVTLQCSLDDQPVQNLSWFKDDNRVFESSSITIRNNGTLLSIFPVKAEDTGFYTCGPDTGRKHKEHLVSDSPSVVAPVLGTLFAIVVVFTVIYIGMRIRRLHASHTPISYNNLLYSKT